MTPTDSSMTWITLHNYLLYCAMDDSVFITISDVVADRSPMVTSRLAGEQLTSRRYNHSLAAFGCINTSCWINSAMHRGSSEPDLAGAEINAPATAQSAFEQATILHDRNRLEAAEALYETALALDPDHAEALCSLGFLRLQQNQLATSVALLRQAIQLDAALAEALACHETALALAPDYTEAMSHRGRALQALGRLTDAVMCYEAALAQAPDDAALHLALATVLTA